MRGACIAGSSQSVPGYSSEHRLECVIPRLFLIAPSYPHGRWPRRPQKKTWGGKKTRVRVKRGLRGQIKRPLPQIKRPWGPCDPMAAKRSRQNPGNGGDQPSAREAHPLALTRARGRRDHPIFCPLRRERLLGLLEQVCSRKTKRGKAKTGTRSKEAPLPPRVQLRRGASNLKPPPLPRESKNRQNARGPEP